MLHRPILGHLPRTFIPGLYRRRRSCFCLLWILGLCVFVFISNSWAQPLNFKGYSLVPSLRLQQIWTDNVALDPEDQAESAWGKGLGFSLDFGLKPLMLDTPRQTLNCSLNAERLSYASDRVSDYNRVNANLDFSRICSPKIKIEIKDGLYSIEDLEGTYEGYKLGEQTTRWFNRLQLTGTYAFDQRLRIQGTFEQVIYEFRSSGDAWQNFLEYRPSLRCLYEILPKTSALLEYGLRLRTYPEQNSGFEFSSDFFSSSETSQDYWEQSLLLGLVWEGSSKLTGGLMAGLSSIRFLNEQSFLGVDYENNLTWDLQASLHYAWGPKTTVTLLLDHRQVPASNLRSTLQTQIRGQLGLEQQIGKRFRFETRIGAYRYDYDDGSSLSSRTDDRLSFGASLSYALRHFFSLKLGYGYRSRDSGLEQDDFTANSIYVNLTAVYD